MNTPYPCPYASNPAPRRPPMRVDFPIPIAEFAATLINLPDQIAEAEEAVIAARGEKLRADEALEMREFILHQEGVLNGGNETVRKLQLRGHTIAERLAARTADERWASVSVHLHRLQHRLAAYRAATRLIGGDDA